MDKNLRVQQIEFIYADIDKRGEDDFSDINFFGAIYSLKVKKNGKTKTVTYSAAENVMKGYRAITP